jgi:hypothetical protein
METETKITESIAKHIQASKDLTYNHAVLDTLEAVDDYMKAYIDGKAMTYAERMIVLSIAADLLALRHKLLKPLEDKR